MEPGIALIVILMSVIGGAIGTFTGLVPGIHVNTLSAVMLASYQLITDMISPFVPAGTEGICVACCIFSASIVHSFVDYVPSVFIGAPDPDDVVGMLPGHRLLSQGRGMVAIRAAAIGSCIGACASTIISIPLQYLLFNGLGDQLNSLTWIVLIFVIGMMILHEETYTGMFWAAVCIIISGIFGLICMDADIPSSGPLMESTLLFPMLTGMFGITAMLSSLKNTKIPEQTDDVEHPVGIIPGLKGLITGTLTGWFPGITATTGAVISGTITPEKSAEGFISMVASIGTASAVMMLTTMSVTGSGRSGATVIIAEILGDEIIGMMNQYYLMLLLTAAVASYIGYRMTISCGRMMMHLTNRIDSKKLNISCLILVIVLVYLLTGPYGLLIMTISALIGLLPIKFGVSRITLTGCLIIPTALSSLGIRDIVLSILF